MQSPRSTSIQSLLRRYGPGTERSDVAAGYTAAVGAVFVAALYVASVWAIKNGVVDLGWSPYFAELEFHWAVYAGTAGLAVAAPTAFLVGVAGWRLLSPQTMLRGAAVGALGAVATYAAAAVPLAAVFVAVSGAPANAVELAGFTVLVGFALTWWAAVPVGCLAGAVQSARSATVV